MSVQQYLEHAGQDSLQELEKMCICMYKLHIESTPVVVIWGKRT